MGAGRIILGMLFGLVTAFLIVFFVTLSLTVSDYAIFTNPAIYAVIALLLMHPYGMLTLGIYSAIAAPAAGAFVGGLVSKGAKNGLIAGLLMWVVVFLLYIGLGYSFDFGAMITTWDMIGMTNVIIDFAMGLGIFCLVGAIGGAITGGGE